MSKLKIVLCTLLIIGAQIQVVGQSQPSEHYNVINKDSLYIFSSDTHILLFSSPGEAGLFTFLNAIPGTYSSETTLALNADNLLIENKDTLFLYDILEPYQPQLLFMQSFNFEIDDVIGFGTHFLLQVDNHYKLISKNGTEFVITDDTLFTPWNAQLPPAFSYPYIIYRNYIYKYLENFGLYLSYITNDYSVDLQFTYDNVIEFYYFYSNGYPNPPSWGLIGRSIQEPGFPILFTWYYWPPWSYGGLKEYIAITKKYVLGIDDMNRENICLNTSGGTMVYTHTATDYSLSITDNHIFQLGESILYSNPADPDSFFVLDYNIVSVSNNGPVINEYKLYNNYPNPFNSSTKIKYELSEPTRVSLVVLNLLGEEIAILENEEKLPGTYQVTFNADLPSGIYFYRLQTETFSETKKLILLK